MATAGLDYIRLGIYMNIVAIVLAFIIDVTSGSISFAPYPSMLLAILTHLAVQKQIRMTPFVITLFLFMVYATRFCISCYALIPLIVLCFGLSFLRKYVYISLWNARLMGCATYVCSYVIFFPRPVEGIALERILAILLFALSLYIIVSSSRFYQKDLS
ncbi:MAG: hypothetical protein UU47_C0028G0003 [candidate division TM6 bacterium GW2011_GWE2_41_16]|nr:MAG: hypothetical protein UU47_C0028G0003 [candidate division TM6 bacterium GW2011_GWE2_41_16]